MFSKNYKSSFKIASHGRVLLVTSFMCASLYASPTGGVVTSGTASIVKDGSTTNINQQTNKASINWQGFSISPNEAVNFNQPNQNSLTLNRVVGNEKSVIEGVLNANGKVFLINSNGVLFTKGSSVNTAGLVASTLNLSDEDFNSDNFVFKADPNNKNSVINLGTITTTDEGYVVLLGESVINDGVIIANKGTVSLNSADKITLNFNGNSLINVSLDEGTLNSLVESNNAIIADGGLVILTAKAANELISSKVNVKGVIKAQTIGDLKGEININAYNGKADIDGNLEASFVETSGDKVKISDSTTVKADKWLIDPTDFTIGDGGDISGQALSNNLETADIEIQSTKGSKEGKGDINVNDKVEWSADTTLTLTADNDININNAIIAHGDKAGVALNYGGDYNILTLASFSGVATDENGNTIIGPVYDKDGKLAGEGPVAKTDTSGGVYGSITFWGDNAKLTINNQEYILIHSKEDLEKIATGYYALARELDLSETPYSQAVIAQLNGAFTGLGHVIDGLKGNAGLFAATTQGSVIRDVGLTNVDITSTIMYTGSLVGSNSADINNVYATGKIEGVNLGIGGLIGLNSGTSTISDSFTDVSVTGRNYVGGLIGVAQINPINILNSHTLGDVISTGTGSGTGGDAGGLVGFVASASLTIRDSYATGDIISTSGMEGGLGGLLGRIGGNCPKVDISDSFAIGDITGSGGGLVGDLGVRSGTTTVNNVYAAGDVSNGGGGLIGSATGINLSDAFATGDVGGTGTSGGLIGSSTNSVINDVYATGDVTGGTIAGGLIGSASGGTISNVYATGDVRTTAGTTSATQGGGGLVGYAARTSILDSWASGNVDGVGKAGGFVGTQLLGTITDSYSTGSVNTAGGAGAFAGTTAGAITNSYATGTVNGETAEVLVGGGMGSHPYTVDGGGMLTNEEFAYIDELTSGDMTLEEVKTDIINVKAAEAERIRQEELAEQERQRVGALALNNAESVRVALEKEVKAKESRFKLGDISLAPTDILTSNMQRKDYDTNINAIELERQAYTTGDEGEKE
jgi:filamentous hemagglutinin family protein